MFFITLGNYTKHFLLLELNTPNFMFSYFGQKCNFQSKFYFKIHTTAKYNTQQNISINIKLFLEEYLFSENHKFKIQPAEIQKV